MKTKQRKEGRKEDPWSRRAVVRAFADVEANPIWISPYERLGARLVPRPARFLFRRGNEGRCSLRRVGSRVAFC